ncbi:MAG TPA: hypothetical protein VFB06_12455 [Streptosporangiaceae bacterium]|nr:hypothetical protein [Streptosporangiaceae bacterium]
MTHTSRPGGEVWKPCASAQRIRSWYTMGKMLAAGPLRMATAASTSGKVWYVAGGGSSPGGCLTGRAR